MNYGGQAVIDGVMMRGKRYMTIAVRLNDGSIKVRRETINKFPFSKIFFIRGIFNLIETIRIGLFSLNWSAKQQLDADEQDAGLVMTVGATLLSIVAAVLIFKVIPFFLAKLVVHDNIFLFNLLDGFIKLGMFIGYIWVITLFDDVKELFQYHGAEHKAIGCAEYKEELTVANCRKYEKEHKKCGTNFLFIVIFISIFVYLFIPLNMNIMGNLILRILFLPIIAGIGYEIIRFSGMFDNWFIKAITLPGILIQKLTTYVPNDKQLEVSIVALKELIKLEETA